jgi:DNA polymerase III subunit delta'
MTHNWPVYGHDWAVDYLRKGMENGRVRHAYLIAGTAGIGKNTLAHAFAMALNCVEEDPAHRPCGECRSCRQVVSGNHPDLLYTETDPTTGALKIEEVRSLTSRIAMKPYQARYRVAVLQDFDHAQPRAQDALLKTLEEPPPHAVLILLASSLEPILPTITSRSQVIHLRPVAADVISAVLMADYELEEEQAVLLARLSGGRLGWAISAVQQPEVFDQRMQALDLLEQALQMNRAGRFDLAQDLSRDKVALAQLLELWLTYWRDVLLMTENSPVRLCNIDRQVTIEQLVYTVTPEQALEALRATQTLLDQLTLNINLRLAIEVMFLSYPGLVVEQR